MDRREVAVELIGQVTQRYLDQIDEHGDLPHAVRLRLHTELEESTGQDLFDAFVDASAACAVKVWPIWRDRYPDDPPFGAPTPGATIQDPRLQLAPTRTDLRRVRSFLDRRLWLFPEDSAAVTAALCCWRTNAVVLAGEIPREPDGGEESLDPAWYAVIAVAGQQFEDRNDPAARRDFWVWYLTEAVPHAYQKCLNSVDLGGHPPATIADGAESPA